jgi:glycosyltransferase involved in cell wall biosynthesis
LLRQEVAKSDLVFLQDGFYLPCFLAANAARRHNKPVVVMQHIGVVAYRAAILRIAMNMLDKVSTRPLLERADRVVFISALTRSYYADLRYHRPPEIIFNGVDAAVFHPLPGSFDRARNRRALGADPSSPCILFVGRFVEKKGLHHIEAMARAQPDWTWILAGWGPLDPRQWSLPNVQVIGGLSGPTLATLYQHADSLVLPSIGEGYPLVIQEALACGLPVVCSEVTAQADPAASEYIIGATMHEDSRMTASAFIQKLEAIVSIDDGTEFENRRKRALFAATRYNWATAAQRLKEIFNQAIASHRGLGA